MNPILYKPELDKLLMNLNSLILNKNKSALKNFVFFCQENHQFLK